MTEETKKNREGNKEKKTDIRPPEEKIEECNRIIERLCERDIIFKTLPYSISAFLQQDSADHGLPDILNRLERAFAVSGAFLLSLDPGEKSGSVLSYSHGCPDDLASWWERLPKDFPLEDLSLGYLRSGYTLKHEKDILPLLLVPVLGKRSFFGCLGILESSEPRQWDEVEYDTLRGMGTTLAHIMEFLELKENLEEDRNNLELLVEERTAELRTANTALKNEALRRKKAQYALRNRHKILREMYNRVPVGAVIIGADGTFDFSNHYFRFMTGYGKKELLSLRITDILGTCKTRCFDENGVFRADLKDMGSRILHKSGREAEVRITSFPLQNDTEKAGGIVCLFNDLGRQKEYEHRERMMKIQLTRLTLELDKLKAVITGDTEKPKNMNIDTFGLTKREKETLMFALQGYRTREISKRMGVVEVTIRKNLTSIFRKLEVRDRYELIEKYRDLVFSRD
ncbi:MAG: PAS domain S-box protein [Spirochaetales bacterium]|nr:PAS domain S-box protein [Spirochaetales bacterium]